MRIYLNPCFTRYSFDKNEKQKMPRSSNLEEDKVNSINRDHENFAVEDAYRIEDNLTMEYRGHINKPRWTGKSRIIGGVVIFLVLLLLIGVIAFVCIYVQRENSERSRNKCQSEVCSDSKNKNSSTSLNGDKSFNKIDKSIINNDICYTQKCKSIANYLKKTMNMSADPCDNFHEYACGKWADVHPLPPSMPKLDTMGLLTYRKMKYLKEVIEQESKKTAKGWKAKILKFYKSCINSDLFDSRNKNPLLDLIDRLGGWSPINSWIDNNNVVNITELLIRTHKYFTPSVYDDRVYSPLFKSGVKVNDSKSTQHILEVNIPDFPLKDPLYFVSTTERAKEIRKKYALLKTNYVALLGPSNNAEGILEKMKQFEFRLVNITFPYMERRNQGQKYHSISIQEFSKYVGSEINWVEMIRGIFKPTNTPITEATKIGIRSLNYFKDLNDLIKQTNRQIVKDYIVWVFVWRYGPYASVLFREADYNFQKALIGIEERPKRWKACVKDIEETMEFGLTALYVEKALTDKDKVMANEIVQNVTREFKKNLVNVDWMDVSTKAEAFKKVDAIVGNIGYPDYVKNDTYLDELYKSVKIHPRTYFKNVLNMYEQKRISNLVLLEKPVDRTAYDLPPTLVEAYFDPNKNKMVFLAGILHVPFYDTQVPMALNYGALGLVVGHEVTHAFDDLGRQFDGLGEMRNWWSSSSLKQFRKRSNCIKQQYSNYTVYGLNLNGAHTLGENIADNGGIKVAYMAYKDWERTHGREKKLPDIQLNMDQLFFVSHGQVWCGAYREEYVKMSLNTDYHSPSKFRIIGPLSNLKQFSDTFKCPLGSRMNPVKKCRVW